MPTRRDFLRHASAASAVSGVPLLVSNRAFAAGAQRIFEPGSGTWRTFDVTTRVEIDAPSGATQVWVPVPSVETDWQRSLSDSFTSNGQARVATDGKHGVKMVHAQFGASTRKAIVEVTSRVQTRDRATDWNVLSDAREDSSALAVWKQPTALIPTDGLVRATALRATVGAATEREKVIAIYDWVARNAHREPAVRGCGEGDVLAMLKSDAPAGKCADINGLFVGMCRAIGIPARDLYGIRVAASAFGYRELGGNPDKLSAAQHCRAEAYLNGHGWVAMDPADVTKVMRQESTPWIKSLDHPLVAPVHEKLKGCCEGNWMAYNSAHDVTLPGSHGKPLAFLMYPIAETAGGRMDSYAPDDLRYSISSREITG